MPYSITDGAPDVSFNVPNAEKLMAQAFNTLGITTNAQRDAALTAPLQTTLNLLLSTFVKCFNLE
jgi:hypothetical protein